MISNIAFITPKYPPRNVGGAGISSKLIVEGIRKRNINVDVFTIGGKNSQVHRNLNSKLFSRFPDIIHKNMSVLQGQINEEKYDLIHVYSPGHSPAANMKFSKPVVTTVVNHWWVCLDPIQYLEDGLPDYNLVKAYQYSKTADFPQGYRQIAPLVEKCMKHIVSKSDAITVQTPSMMNLLRKCGYQEANIQVVSNLPDPIFNIDDSKSKGLIFVGRLSDEKGPLELLRAYSRLPLYIQKEYPLTIYGKGPLETALSKKVSELSMPNVKITTENYYDLPKKYSEADIMIHPAKWPEPFSRTWLEAMATSTGVISSTNPSAIDVFSDNAEYFEPGDVEELSEVLESVLSNRDNVYRLKKSCGELINNYRSEQVIDDYMSVYQKITSGN